MRPPPVFIALVLSLGLLVGARAATAPPPPIALVVHPGDASRLDGRDQVELIYLRKRQLWPDGNRIIPVNLPAAHPLRRAFSRLVLGRSPEELERYWNDAYFHGLSPPYVLASPEAVMRFVASTPGSVGYVSVCDADARVEVALVLGESGPLDLRAARNACPH